MLLLGQRRLRVLCAVGVFAASVFASAVPASAHATVVAATPAPGTGLPQAPGAVVIRFTEPLNPRLSRIEVLDDGDRDVGVGPTRLAEGDAKALHRRLPLLSPGRFTVRWTTVSTLDGHSRRGSYVFGIGTTASASQRVIDGPFTSEGWTGVVGRFLALAGLGLWAGAGFIGARAARAGLASARLVPLAIAAPALALAGTAVSLISSSVVAGGALASVLDAVAASQSAQFRLLAMLASAVGMAVAGRSPVGYRWAALAAVAAEAASGHAASGPLPFLAAVSFGAHLVAGGIWTFAVVAALLAWPRARAVLAALSPFAVGAAAATVLTGVVNAAFGLTRPSELTSSGYGRGVLAKSALAVAMIALGAVHLRRRRRGAPTRSVRRPVAVEAAVMAAAFAVAGLLASIPDPPRQAGAEVVAGSDPVLGQLASYDALSVAEPSGAYVVGLTIYPPRPGHVQVRLHLVGGEAGQDVRVRSGSVRASTPGQAPVSMALRPCGSGCLAGRGHIPSADRWQFEASVDAGGDPVPAVFAVPLPAPDGAAEIERALKATENLRSAAMREELRGAEGGKQVVASYHFAAPDAFEMRVNDSHRIVIGNRRWQRSSPGEPWKEGEWPGEAFRWPESHYRVFWMERAATRVLGEEVVDGVPSRIVSFVRPGLPAWFKVSVGIADGLVRREAMVAEGHLMTRFYEELNGPTTIDPPVVG
ncbi:MAG: copper resistance protein CopC [Actinobacteria bacterium]|nr:copper resistance protein CopC [Actinomycetota bacterium]